MKMLVSSAKMNLQLKIHAKKLLYIMERLDTEFLNMSLSYDLKISVSRGKSYEV